MEPVILDNTGYVAFFDVATSEAQAVANSLIEHLVEPRPLTGTEENPDGLTPGDRARNKTLLAAACEVLIRDVLMQDVQVALAVTMLRLQEMVAASQAHPDFKPLYQSKQTLAFLADEFPNSEYPDVLSRVRRLKRAEERRKQEETQGAGDDEQVTPSGIITTH